LAAALFQGKKSLSLWSVPREWPGETVFIIAGGPSVNGHDLNVLRGRKVIAINSSYLRAPFAQYLFAGDQRWLRLHKKGLMQFAGTLVTCTNMIDWPDLKRLTKISPPPGLSKKPTEVVCRRTSMQGAMNFVVHLGAARIILLGADGCADEKGRTHHHAPHPWPHKPDAWAEQAKDLATMGEPLRALGIEVINANPKSRIDLWPKAEFSECV
jgi:hypothetical protein